MTVPGGRAASSSAAGPRPLLLQVAAILLFVCAALSLLLPTSLLVSREFAGCSIAVGSSSPSPNSSSSPSPSASGSQTPSLSQSEFNSRLQACEAGTGDIRPDTANVNGAVGRQVLQSILPAIIFLALGFFTWRGTPTMRWVVVGLWVIANVYPLVSFSPYAVVGYFQAGGYPPVFLSVLAIGAVVFTVAAVLVNLPSVTRYLNARRPVRTAANRPPGGGGGLFGGMFGPRPPAGGAGGAVPRGDGGTGISGGSYTPPAGGGTPAPTRPAKSKGTGGRPGGPRGKSRRS